MFKASESLSLCPSTVDSASAISETGVNILDETTSSETLHTIWTNSLGGTLSFFLSNPGNSSFKYSEIYKSLLVPSPFSASCHSYFWLISLSSIYSNPVGIENATFTFLAAISPSL